MKLFCRFITLTLCLLAQASPGHAASYANEVMAIGVGARALGMGGAYVGLADDSTSVYWNPAGLPGVKHIEISAIQQGKQYSGLSLNEVGSRYIFASGAMNFGNLGAFGASFMRFGVEEIPYVTGLDSFGVPIQAGTFQTQDIALMGSWGKQWMPAFNTGLSLKYLSGGTVGLASATGDASYSEIGGDLGIRVDFGAMSPNFEGLTLGLNVQDVFNTGAAWKNTPSSAVDKVDMNPKIGLAYALPLKILKETKNQVIFAFDVDPKYSPNTLYHLGGEFWYKEMLGIRSGLRQFAGGIQNMELSFGASFRFYILQLDYAFINYELTPVHYLSLALKF